MFTLMPVAAFASEDEVETTVITVEKNGLTTTHSSLALAFSETADINGATISLPAGEYTMPAKAQGKTFEITGTKAADTIIKVIPGGQSEAGGQLDYSLDGSTVTFNNVTIETNGNLYAGYARLSATYNNCIVQNTYNLGTGNSEFNKCVINIKEEYLRINGANTATFNECTFNTVGRAILVFQDGTKVAQTITVKDCIFNATNKAQTGTGLWVAAVSFDGSQGGTYTVNFEGTNTVDSNFNGLWQDKTAAGNVSINGVVPVSNSAQLKGAIAAAGTAGVEVKLLNNIELTESVAIPEGAAVELNLNGYDITGDKTDGVLCPMIHVKSGNVTVTGSGTITSDGDAFYLGVKGATEDSANSAKLTLGKDVAVTANEAGVVVYAGTLTTEADITGGPDYTAIQGSGNSGNDGTVINVNGGKLSAPDAIYHPQAGTLNITAGEITGVTSGIAAKAGTINITGGTIKATGEGETGEYDNGVKADGSAIFLESNDDYAGAIKVYISGENTVVSSAKKTAIGGAAYTNPDQIEEIKITGGKFSSNPTEYVVKGYVVVADGANFVVKPEVKATGITISPASLTLVEGATFEALTVALTADGTTTDTLGEVTWASDKPEVATVDANGVVKAVKAGEATITAAANGFKAECVVTVEAATVAVTGVTLSADAVTLTVDETATLEATVLPNNATDNTVTWTSDKPEVATVEAGVVKAVAAGTATITAKAGEKTATCVVTVKAKAPEVIAVTNITLNKTELTLVAGSSETLTATVEPDNATDKTVTWESSNEDVVTVVDGVVTAVAVGEAGIKATAGEWTVACIVTVEAAPVAVENVTLDKTTATVKVGNTVQLTATVAPEGATNKNVIWASDNTSVATVDATGKVTAVAKGTANITVTTECGAKTATCAVTVESATTGGGGSVGGGSSSSSSSNKTESSTTTTVTPSGSTVKVETETKTESDGTKVETETTTTTTTTGETTKVETTTETKTDGTVVETTTTTDSKGDTTTVEKTTETNDEGTKIETTVTTDAQGETATTVTATLDNGSAVTNNDEAVKVEVTKVEEAVVTKVEEAVAADETVEVVGTADNAVSVSATNSSTGAAQSNFVQPMSVNVPVDKAVLDNVTDTSKLTMAKVVTNEDGTTELVYMGGSYDEETGTFNAKVDEDGDYILVEKADLVKIELTIDDTTVKHNDNHHEMDVAPKINAEEGRTELPLRYLGEALGFDIHWDNHKITITKGDTVFSMEIGKEIPGFGTPYIDSDRTMVSARYISEMLGANVIWDPVDRQVIVVK